MRYSTIFREQFVIGLARLLTPELQPIVNVVHSLLKTTIGTKPRKRRGKSHCDRDNKTDSCNFSDAARGALKIETGREWIRTSWARACQRYLANPYAVRYSRSSCVTSSRFAPSGSRLRVTETRSSSLVFPFDDALGEGA